MATVIEIDEGGAARRDDAGPALRELFDAHGGAVYGLCAVLLGDRTEAEDATQQAFLSAYESLLRGAVPWSPAAWLAAIARNECRDRLRAQARRPLVPATEQEPAGATVEEIATLNADFLELRHALRELPERQREAILLYELCGLSYGEIAGVLNMSHAAVETLLFRTRKRLRKRVGALTLVPGILAAPLVVGEGLAHAIPGFGAVGQASAVAASATVGGAVGGMAGGGSFAGVAFVKLAALPLMAKVAAVAVTAGVATTMVVGAPGGSSGIDAQASGASASTANPFAAGFASAPLEGDPAEAGILPAFPMFDSPEFDPGDQALVAGSVDAGSLAGASPIAYAGSSRETGPSDGHGGPAEKGTNPGEPPGSAEGLGGDSGVDSISGPIENGSGDDPPASGSNPGEGSSGESGAGGGGGGNGGGGGGDDPPSGGGGNGGGGGGDDPPSGGGGNGGGGGGDDPPAGGGDDPPAGGGGDPPAGGGDDPPAGGGDPPAGGGGDPPAGGGDDPPAGGGDDPPAGGGDDPPSGDDGSGADDGDEGEEADPPGDDDGKKPKKPKKPKKH